MNSCRTYLRRRSAQSANCRAIFRRVSFYQQNVTITSGKKQYKKIVYVRTFRHHNVNTGLDLAHVIKPVVVQFKYLFIKFTHTICLNRDYLNSESGNSKEGTWALCYKIKVGLWFIRFKVIYMLNGV